MAIDRSHQHDAMSAPGRDAASNGADQSVAPDAVVLTPGSDGVVQVPDAAFLTNGNFVKFGADLILTDPGGDQAIVRDYFASDLPPELHASEGGQVLTPELVQSFLRSETPGQYAQTGPIGSTPPIGQIDELTGEAFAVRADGTRVQLAKGDPVYQGDIIETGGDGSAVRMIFADKTMFALGADARLALDELAFNPESLSGSAQFSVLKGVFIFSSGQIAKTDNTDMIVSTPVATIGIRGTEVAGRVDDQGGSQFTVIDGIIEVTTQAGSVTLDSQGETTRVTDSGTPPSPAFVLTPAEYGETYNDVAGVASSYLHQGQSGQPDAPTDGETPEGQDRSNADDGSTESAEESAEQASGTLLASTLPAQESSGPGLAGGAVPGFATAEDPVGENLTPTPGLELALNLTYDGPAGPQNGSPSGDGGEADPPAPSFAPFTPEPDNSTPDGDPVVQPVAYPVDANGNPTSAPQNGAGAGNNDSPSGPEQQSDSPVFGSGDSPFRTHGDGSNPLGNNPYVQDPFGADVPPPDYGGSGDDGLGSSDSAAPAPVEDDDVLPVPAAPVASDPEPDVHAITLTVSNATIAGKFQNLSDHAVLPDLGPSSFKLVKGSDLDIGSVDDSAEIELRRDAAGDVEITLNTAWNSVKNLRAESDTAAEISVSNFVHADIHFGDGGDSHIELVDAKRGFITTGNGNDTIDIDARSNVDTWSKLFDVRTGSGNDTVVFDGADNGLSELFFDGGDGVDTLNLIGPGDSFDLSSSKLQIANIERIDLTGATDLTLTIGPDVIPRNGTGVNPIVGMNDSLVVDGNAGDTVELSGGGWDTNPIGTTEIDGQSYAIYEHTSGDRVVADAAIDVTLV